MSYSVMIIRQVLKNKFEVFSWKRKEKVYLFNAEDSSLVCVGVSVSQPRRRKILVLNYKSKMGLKQTELSSIFSL